MRLRSLVGASRQLVVPVAVAFVLSGTTYALTASNTVPVSKAGTGTATVAGFTVTNINYTLNASDPRNIDAVAFTVDTEPPAGASVRVKLTAAGSTFYSCTNAAANVTCDTTSPQATTASVDELTVVIGQ